MDHQDLEVVPDALLEMLPERNGVKATVNRSHHWMQLGPQRKILRAQGGKFGRAASSAARGWWQHRIDSSPDRA
jgi:hypothetical protein